MKWVSVDRDADRTYQWDRVTDLGDGESICTEVWSVPDGWRTITWFVRPDTPDGLSNYQCLTPPYQVNRFSRTMARANADHEAAVKRFTEWRNAQPEPTELDKIQANL